MDNAWMFPTPKTARRITDQRDLGLFVISVAAELAGVHPQTLRMYERKGLVKPQRTEGRARRYSQEDIERVRVIQWLTQEHGINLAGVEMLIDMNARMAEMQRQLLAAHREIDRLRGRADGGES